MNDEDILPEDFPTKVKAFVSSELEVDALKYGIVRKDAVA